MKKTKKQKSIKPTLSLTSITVRNLTPNDLQQAAGAALCASSLKC